MLMFCPVVKNAEELINQIENGKYDLSIYNYLIELMSESDTKLLNCNPEEYFEIQADLQQEDIILTMYFGEPKDRKYNSKVFDLYVSRIGQIYNNLKILVK